MEDVLDVYARDGCADVARLCFDERPCQLLDDVILPMQEGRSARYDNEYKRQGTCVVLLAYDMDTGQRYAEVRKTRTKADYADFMDNLQKEFYADKRQIVLVQDNLNTHNYGSFYDNLPVERADELRRKIKFHFTPKHGSWLNMAEIEFSALSRQCLDRRIGTMDKLGTELAAWIKDRNEKQVRIHWSFTKEKARETLKSKYDEVITKN